ncbi:hypothetical protein ACFCX4_25960 [Kitasatospora sp. NPDC056327]|uniref:hypothetical protein n=1 Tax=Kitasatospora sp. NPDC056327 TaxID=3345785 RepID=UPI0035E1D87D
MDDEIQLISDGEGLAVIGDPAVVDRFLAAEGLQSEDLGLHRLGPLLDAGSAAARLGSDMAAHSGRWVRLSRESAQLIGKYGLRESRRTGLSTGVVRGKKGQIRGFVEFAKSPRTLLTGPKALAGAAGVMAQLAAKQQMREISDYLDRIDEKVDDVLRAQKDAALSRVIGVGFVIEEVLTVREARGRVDEVTWSKVQDAPTTIAETQAYALRQLQAVAEKLERGSRVGDLSDTAREVGPVIREWLAVLARCAQLQGAMAVLELDRVLDASPDELDAHRLGLKAARQERLEHVARTTGRLLARMEAVAGTANAKVLLHPAKSPALVESSNQVAGAVHDFHERLGIESGRASARTRRWTDAAAEARDKALETGAKGVGAARNLGNDTLDRAGTAVGRLSLGIAERARRRRAGEEPGAEGQGGG